MLQVSLTLNSLVTSHEIKHFLYSTFLYFPLPPRRPLLLSEKDMLGWCLSQEVAQVQNKWRVKGNINRTVSVL